MTRITHMKAAVKGTVAKRRPPLAMPSIMNGKDGPENRVPPSFGFSWGKAGTDKEEPPVPVPPVTRKKKAKKLTDSRTPSLSSLASIKERGRKLKAKASQRSLSESQLAPMNKRKRTRRGGEHDQSGSESEMGLTKRKHAGKD